MLRRTFPRASAEASRPDISAPALGDTKPAGPPAKASQSWLMEAQPLGMLEVANILMAVLATMPWCYIRGYEMDLAFMGAWPTTRREDVGTRPVIT